MLLAMSLRCFFRVAPGMKAMSSGCVSVVGGLLVLSAFVMLGCFPMVAGGVGMMLRGFLVVFRSFLRHWFCSYQFAYWSDNWDFAQRMLVSCAPRRQRQSLRNSSHSLRLVAAEKLFIRFGGNHARASEQAFAPSCDGC